MVEYPHKGQSYYCSFHEAWEVDDGDPDGKVLCEWCCHPKPCPLHGEGGSAWVEHAEAVEEEAGEAGEDDILGYVVVDDGRWLS